MQTRSLETLVRIHQVQSFTQAALLQNMTLSALSMQMRALETELNAALFDRAFRPPRLTPLGRQVARQAARLLDEQSMLRALCGSETTLSGQFRFGFIQSASVRLLPKFLIALRETAPDVNVQIETGLSEALSEQVQNGQLDGAIVTKTAELSRQLNVDVIATETLAAAVPTAHAETPFDSLPNALPFFHFRPSTGIGKLIATLIGNMPSRPQKVLILDGIEACVECAKAGLGYTILPQPDLERYRDNRIHIRKDLRPPLDRELVFVTRKDAISGKWGPQIVDVFSRAVAS